MHEDPRQQRQAGQIHRRFVTIAAGVSAPLLDTIETLGPRRFPDRADRAPAEFLARAVVGQQLSTRAARSIWGRVEELEASTGAGIPALFTEGRQTALRECGLSAAKVRTLLGIREAWLEGRLVREHLRGLDHAAVSRQLLPLWGVGQWTCDMAALFYCGCEDVWPQQDVTVQKTFQRLIGPRRKPSKWAARFAPHRSWLALYMWAQVDAAPD